MEDGRISESTATMKKNPEQISSPSHSDRDSLHEITCTPAVRGEVQTTFEVVLIMSPW